MIPTQLALTIYQGATFSKVLTLKNSAGTPINLTGAVARMQVRTTTEALTTLIELNGTNHRADITNAAGGEITLKISAADTAALNFNTGVYDLEIQYSDGTVDRILQGSVVLSKEVTR